MSRYFQRIEVRDADSLAGMVVDFLRRKDFNLCSRYGEKVWFRNGSFAEQYIMLGKFENAIEITAFIAYKDMLTDIECESTINGFIGGFGKWPLKKIVKDLIKLIQANKEYTLPDKADCSVTDANNTGSYTDWI